MMHRMFVRTALVVLALLVAAPAWAHSAGGGYGYGMMGPGMMYGPGGYGYGMMGPGMMYGYGYDGMGPGMMYGYGYDGNPPKELQEAYDMQRQFAERTDAQRREYYEKSRQLALELSQQSPDKAKVDQLASRIKVLWGELYDASIDLDLKMAAKGLDGYGYGMMGYGGMMGPGMMGYGMMGPGMMYGYPGYGN